MILNPSARVRVLSGGPIFYKSWITAQGLPKPPFGVVHWVPEQLNIKAVTGACKLIDGCSLELYSATLVASSGICHRNKSQLNCMTLSRAQPEDSNNYITLRLSVIPMRTSLGSYLGGTSYMGQTSNPSL